MGKKILLPDEYIVDIEILVNKILKRNWTYRDICKECTERGVKVTIGTLTHWISRHHRPQWDKGMRLLAVLQAIYDDILYN